jgi:cytochrome c oxidase subunit 2
VSGALAPAGVQAATIARLGWILGGVCAVVWALVVLTLLLALARRRGDEVAPIRARTEIAELVIGIAVAATVGILFAFAALSYATGHALASLDVEHAVVAQVVGHQFWWEVRYNDPEPSKEVTTANEIHVPVGIPVVLNLSTRDVIHSFWVPSLTGKRDLIPGHENHVAFRADQAGVFEGQCAEFCGFQHANMRIRVVAEPPAAFFAWLEGQRGAAPTPTDDQAWAGKRVLESRSCALCHTVRGAEANGRLGPDLTHVANRATLAAGALPNTDENLAHWILDPQRVKPGSQMPPTRLEQADLDALVHYLRTLG